MKKVLYGLFVFVGLSQGIGYLTGINAFYIVGRLSGFSPAPVPFSSINGKELLKQEMSITIKTPAGKRRYGFDRDLFKSLTGQQLRRTFFYVAVSNLGFWPKDLQKFLLQRFFCAGGALSQDDAVEEVIYEITQFGDTHTSTTDLKC